MKLIPSIMVQGTGSNVGKSLIVAGLCRAFVDAGMRVVPFKPQNMSNNAGVAPDTGEGGGEIGRAQMLQARAARVKPSVHMNPVLLKPESETGAQVIVQGRRWATLGARDYGERKRELMPAVLESFGEISRDADLVIVEGAGSPAEINLRANDIANMGFAEAADLPVILVADIDRGGVIASIVGTHAVLPEAERRRIRGFLINRFRGDPSLFAEGMEEIARRTGWAGLGIVRYIDDAARLPAEDVLDLPRSSEAGSGKTKVAVPRLPRIANFDDLDPLRAEPEVEVVVVEPGSPIPGDCALVLIPGSKATISDLAALRREGWDIDILAHVRRGGAVLGLCGGYQMLGRSIADPDGIEGIVGTYPGLGLLDVETTLSADKTTTETAAVHAESGEPVAGYEIHLGRTLGPDAGRPFLAIAGRSEGAVSAGGNVAGTYMHGLFAADGFRRAFLAGLGVRSTAFYDAGVDEALDRVAAHFRRHLDLEAILAIARSRTP
jgi:adenosylcobyric acid synthase